MRKITAFEFEQAVKRDPAWASKLTEPVEITDYCDMSFSKITSLSPLLHFTYRGTEGNSAIFWGCESLKIAEGNFAGCVNFSNSGIEKIGDLTCEKNDDGYSAKFWDCESLKIAEGNFPGFANFSNSGIEKIKKLTCGKNRMGNSASFTGCESLKIAEGNFPGFASFANSGIEKIGDLTCGKNVAGNRLDVTKCKLEEIPINFNPREIVADPKLLEKLKRDRIRKTAEKHLQTAIIKI